MTPAGRSAAVLFIFFALPAQARQADPFALDAGEASFGLVVDGGETEFFSTHGGPLPGRSAPRERFSTGRASMEYRMGEEMERVHVVGRFMPLGGVDVSDEADLSLPGASDPDVFTLAGLGVGVQGRLRGPRSPFGLGLGIAWDWSFGQRRHGPGRRHDRFNMVEWTGSVAAGYLWRNRLSAYAAFTYQPSKAYVKISGVRTNWRPVRPGGMTIGLNWRMTRRWFLGWERRVVNGSYAAVSLRRIFGTPKSEEVSR